LRIYSYTQQPVCGHAKLHRPPGAAVQSLFDEQGEVTQNTEQTGGSACKAGVTPRTDTSARSFQVFFMLLILPPLS